MPHYHQPSIAHARLTPKRSHLSIYSHRSQNTKETPYPTPSPFEMLPIELQIEIFSKCLPIFSRFDNTEGPLLLSRVCKTWNNLVFYTPKLWSAFEIEIHGSSRDTTATHDTSVVKKMSRWLVLSKNYPLSVRIAHNPVGRVPDKRSARLLALLIPHARRWRDIQLILPASNITAFQQSLPIDLPQLQALTIHLNGLSSADFSFNITELKISWRHLASLNLQLEHNNLLSLDKCLEIFSQAENLDHFTANTDCVLSHPEKYMEQISLPKLETLDLVFHGGEVDIRALSAMDRPEAQMTYFLSCLSLPRLRDLRLGWLVRQAAAWTPSHPKFTAFLRSVAQTVQSLNIRYLPLSADELIQCLSELPFVCHLDLRFSLGDFEKDPITDQLFINMGTLPIYGRKRTSSIQPLLPLLQSLNLQCYGRRYTLPALVKFFDVRGIKQLNPGSEPILTNTLTSFHLLSMQPLPSIENRLSQYRHAGLDISIDTLVI